MAATPDNLEVDAVGNQYVIVTKRGRKDHVQTGRVTKDGYRARCGVVGKLVRVDEGSGEQCVACGKPKTRTKPKKRPNR